MEHHHLQTMPFIALRSTSKTTSPSPATTLKPAKKNCLDYDFPLKKQIIFRSLCEFPIVSYGFLFIFMVFRGQSPTQNREDVGAPAFVQGHRGAFQVLEIFLCTSRRQPLVLNMCMLYVYCVFMCVYICIYVYIYFFYMYVYIYIYMYIYI